jgi:hypothetical protein
MNYEEISKPSLVEPGVKYFLDRTLKQCKDFKDKHNNLLFNIFLFIFFLLILASILLYKYKGKLSPSEKEKRDREKQQYILTRIKNFQDAKRLASQELITGLPNWENEYDVITRRNL